jgi:L-arabinose isomerase
MPDFETAVSAWICAGGAHHTVYTYDLDVQAYRDFAEIAGIECAVIDSGTDLERFRQDLRLSEAYWHLAEGYRGH